MDPVRASLLRQLPKVDELLRHPGLAPALTPPSRRTVDLPAPGTPATMMILPIGLFSVLADQLAKK